MRNRIRSIAFLAVLVSISLILVGCERDRPVPTPVPTATQDMGAGRSSQTAQPGGSTALPASSGQGSPAGGQAGPATPAPLSGQNVPPPTAAAGTPKAQGEREAEVYVVQDGDTLASIASLYGLSEAEILDANPDIADSSEIYVGQPLLIPSSTATTPETGEATTYAVQPGDTLSTIAVRYGVTVEALQEANGIEDPDMIIMGHVLIIP